MKIRALIIILFIFHVGLCLFHLNHTPMWDDEASVVWFAENYNKYGKIVGYDGMNLFSYRNGQLIDNELIYNNPPLDIYFTAYVIRFFGNDDFTVRMAFCIAGFIALALFIGCMKLITDKDKTWFVFSAVLVMLSVNYLLIEANSRYYSLNFLFGASSLLATFYLVRNPSLVIWKKSLIIVLQLVSIYLLFLSHYLAGVCWWVTCFFVLFQYRVVKVSVRDKFTWITIGLNMVCFGFTAYYFITHQALNRPDMSSDDSIGVKYVKLFHWLISDLNRINLVPIWSLFVFVFLFLFRRKLLSSDFKRTVGFSLVFLSLSYLLNPQPTSRSSFFDIRYIYCIIPVLYMWIAYLLTLVYTRVKWGKVISVSLALIFINTTLLSYMPNNSNPRWLLPAYIKERIEPYPTAYSKSLEYINTHFTERKKILTIPGYHNTVFLRYVSDKIEITNTLDANTPLSEKVVDSLGMQCLKIGQCKPDYVFLFGRETEYETSPFKAEDYKFTDTIQVYALGMDITRPELFWHSFGPEKDFDPKTEALYIFHN